MEIRLAAMDDLAAVTALEAVCFPPAEAAQEDSLRARLAVYSLNLEMTSSTLEMALSNSRTMKPISLPAKVPSLENTLTTSCEMELLL